MFMDFAFMFMDFLTLNYSCLRYMLQRSVSCIDNLVKYATYYLVNREDFWTWV